MEANDNKIKYQFFDEQGKSHTVDQSEYDGRTGDYARLYPKDQMRMVDKHGQSGLVPASEVETAIKQGYRPFTISYSAPASIPNAPLNSVQPIGQTMENKAREEQAQLQKPIQQIQKTVNKEYNSQPGTVNLGRGNVPAVPTPIQPQKPLKDIISDSDKEFNTSIAPKIDSFISQHKNAALQEMRSDDGSLSANQYVGAMAAKGQRYMSEIDAQNVLNDVRNYIGQKTGNGKGGNGVDPHTDRIMQRTIDYLAKKDMPKSSVEYILKNMIDGSLIGTVGNAILGKSSTQQEVEQRGNELYNPSWVEKGVAGAGAMAIDAPIFGGLGGISSKVFKLGTKALTKHVARQLAEKAGEKVISNATLEQAGRIVSQNTPKMIAQRIGMNAAESASTLGMYNTADDAINQAIQINNGSQDKYSLKQTAKSGLSGILMGAAFGVTDGAFVGVSSNMTGLKRVGTEIGGLASSAAVGTGVSTLEKYAQGEPVDIGEDYLTNIAMFGAMKLPHIGNINLKSADPKDREILKSTLAFTPEQKGELKNAGYDANHLVSTIAQLSANKKQKAATVEEQRNVSLVEDTNRDKELFGKEYVKIMQNPDISLSTKSKILYLVEGKLAVQPAITGYKTSTDEKGETILTTNDWTGRIIDKKAFKNNKDANTYIQKNNLLDNSIRNSIAFSEQLNDRAVEGVYKRQAIRNVATKYGISSDAISKIIADKAEGKELPDNGDKMLDEIKWTVESDPEFIKRTSAAKAQDVKDTTGIDVDNALKKNKAERTEDEEKAISMYVDKLQKGFRTEEESKDDNMDSIFDSNKQDEDIKKPTDNNIQQHEEENKADDDAEEQILSNVNKEGNILRVQTFGGDIVNVIDGHLEFDENGKVDLSKSDPEIYYKDQDGRTKVGSTENIVSKLVDETDADELAAQAKQDAENKQSIENSSEESPINALVPIGKGQQNVSNEQEDIQTQPQENTQSYLDRIPKDNEGNPLFEQAEPENTAGTLLEMNDGDNTEAIDTAKQMSSNYESEIKKLEKKSPIGKSVVEIQNAKKQKKEALTKLQNLYDYWNGISGLLEQTPTHQTAQPQAVEQQAPISDVNAEDYKEKTLIDKPKRSRGFYSKENDDMGAPSSLREAVIREIATGGYKFQWKDNENNKTKGLASHLGLKGDESERRGMIGFLSAPDNGGLPPEVVAEKIRGDLGEMFPAATDQEIFNEILDVFHTYGGSRRSMWEEAKKLHGQTEENDPEYQKYLEDIHQKIASSYHMTPEEYDLYNEYIPQKIEEENNTMTDNDYSDFLSTLAEQYNKEENDSRRENIHRQLPEVETIQGNNDRSGPVLHGEENIHNEGYSNSERPWQGGNAEPDKYNDNSLPDSKISGEPELDKNDSQKQKDIFEKPSLDENKEVSLNQNNKNDDREIQQRTDEREPVLQQIPQGEHGEVPERNGGLEQTTGELERRCRIYEAELSRSGKTLSVEERKEIERHTAEDFAKENGLWIPMNKIPDLGVPGPSGNENDTYISGNDIYKVNNLMNSDSIVSLLDKTSLHNKIFPNTKYDFVAFTGFDKRSVFPILKQKLILDAVPASPKEIKSYMKSLGFKETGEALYSNGKIIISDLHPRNVLKSENGNIYVIDDEIKEADSSFVSPEKKREESILNYADRIAAAKELHDEENKVVTNPTDAQKEAGNYKKGHIKIDGFDITIENPKGSVRSGTDANGNKWETEIHNTYGYIRGTEGVDGDHIDVYLSDDPTEGDVFVIDQIDPNTGEFDEHKVMYGFKSIEEAKDAYLSNYSKGWKGLGNITKVSKEEFKKWIDSSKRKTKPFAEYSTVKTDVEKQHDLSSLTESKDIPAMTEEEYLASKGYDFSGIGDSALHKGKQKSEAQQNKVIELQHKKDVEYTKKREELRKEYRDKLAKGELRQPSQIEKLVKAAKGNPNLESTKAALRTLKKRGVDVSDIETTDSNDVQFNKGDGAIPSNSPTTANIMQDRKIMSTAEDLAKTLNTEVHFTNSEDIKGSDEYSIKKRNAKGWYDTKTDEVYINPQNHIDEEDVKQTILHEIVAHKGLRKLLGDRFDDTMNDIFRSLPESERKEISNIFLNSKSWDTVEAAEEYCARLAESEIGKPTIWKTIISKIRELLRKAGINIKMSDNDIKYLLWKSRRHMEDTPDNYSKEFRVKDNIYKDDFVDNRKATPLFRLDPQKLSEKDFNDIIGITKEVAILNEEEQNDFIKRMEHQVLFESWVDKMNPVRVFQETIAKKYKMEIPDECDAHLSSIVMTSRARYEKDTFKSIVFDKMLSAVNKVGQYDDVINYLIAKHGLERNVYMRNQKVEEAIAPLKEQISQIDYLLSRHSISEEEADTQRKSLESKIKKIAAKITEDFANEDFAGLTQLQKELQEDDSELKDIKLNEPYIQHFIDEFEKSHDKNDISDMWDNIHEATNFCLETQRLYGCISKERMEQIKSMYNYYVPLRDWADPQAEDFFTYFYKDRHNLNIPIQKAKGRKTKAGDPIANIGSMADSAIVLGNKNRVKQHLYRLVFNYPTNLAHVSPVWVAWNPNTLTYEEVAFEGINSEGNPLEGKDYDTAFDKWNNRMKSLAKQNIVVQKNEKLSIGVPIKAWQAKQHQVRLTINGKDYIISMDSSPRVAQSINGDNIDEGMQAFQKLKNATGWMAQNFTSKMINFVFKNFFRDYTGAITYNYIYGYSSMKKFFEAAPKASKVLAEYLTTKKIPEGKYGDYLEEFLKNGGETGYTNSMSYKDYFKEIQNEIDKVKHPTKLHLFRWISNAMEVLNRGAEDTTRLSAYIASREGGKSIMKSIYAAKEISVNFNKMGSGRNGNSFIRAWEMFFNAGEQAFNNTIRGFKYHPVKSTIAFGTWTLIGAMKGILQSIYGDDKYYQLPDWIRQNNFTISAGGDLLLNIPLALEIRPFFAMGDILAQVILGKYHGKNAATDIATKFMETAPYNFMEGSNSKGDTFEQILANTLAPSAVKPLIDIYWTNKDYTGRPISKRNEFNEYVPEYKKGYRSTSDLAIAISKGINDLSGGDMAKKGALDSELTNPAVMEYLFNNYGGGVLKQIYGVAKSGYNLVTPGKDVDIRDIPAVSALLYKFDDSKGNSNINERYYKYLDEYEESQSQDREYTKSIMSSEKGAMENYLNKKANAGNEKDMQIIEMYKKIIETIQQKAKSIPDGNESDQLQKQIYGLKKAMVEQLEK